MKNHSYNSSVPLNETSCDIDPSATERIKGPFSSPKANNGDFNSHATWIGSSTRTGPLGSRWTERDTLYTYKNSHIPSYESNEKPRLSLPFYNGHSPEKDQSEPLILIENNDPSPFSIDTLKERDRTILFYYPFTGGSDTMPLCKDDYSRLEEGQFLNDSLVDFYLKYRLEHCLYKYRFYRFSSYFYKVISTFRGRKRSMAENYKKVSKWTSSVNIFNIEFLIIPICEHLHWFLVIIWNCKYLLCPELGKSTVLFVMDSLGSKSKSKIQRDLKEYLNYEAKNKANIDIENQNIHIRYINLPLQTNLFDCGVFLLHYFELFIREVQYTPAFPLNFYEKSTWFQIEEIAKKRKWLRTLLETLAKEYNAYILKNPHYPDPADDGDCCLVEDDNCSIIIEI